MKDISNVWCMLGTTLRLLLIIALVSVLSCTFILTGIRQFSLLTRSDTFDLTDNAATYFQLLSKAIMMLYQQETFLNTLDGMQYFCKLNKYAFAAISICLKSNNIYLLIKHTVAYRCLVQSLLFYINSAALSSEVLTNSPYNNTSSEYSSILCSDVALTQTSVWKDVFSFGGLSNININTVLVVLQTSQSVYAIMKVIKIRPQPYKTLEPTAIIFKLHLEYLLNCS